MAALRLKVVDSRTVRAEDGAEHDVIQAIGQLPWVDQSCPLMQPQYAVLFKSPDVAWRVLASTDVGRVLQTLWAELGEAETATGSDTGAALSLLARRYAGDSAATSHLRLWLEEQHIPYDFQMV